MNKFFAVFMVLVSCIGENVYDEEGEMIAVKTHRVEMASVESSPKCYKTRPIQLDVIDYGGWLDAELMPTAAKIVELEQDGSFISAEQIPIGSYWDQQFGGIPLWDAVEF